MIALMGSCCCAELLSHSLMTMIVPGKLPSCYLMLLPVDLESHCSHPLSLSHVFNPHVVCIFEVKSAEP